MGIYILKAMSTKYLLILIFSCVALLIACEKDITIELQDTKSKIVVEGHIEPGIPPYIILTHTFPYFTYTDVETLENLFVHDAVISIHDGADYHTLVEYCSDSLPDSLAHFGALYLGVDIADLSNHDFCIYSVVADTGNPANILVGELGKTYTLSVTVEGFTYTAVSTLTYPIPFDSIVPVVHPNNDSLFHLLGTLSDPAGIESYYRVFTQRLGKDEYFLPTATSIFNDQLIDGETIDVLLKRGKRMGFTDIYTGYYYYGDTVVVKFCTMDRAHYEFWETALIEIKNTGNPIAAATQIATNLDGGALGIWGAYGAIYDTVIVK